MKPISHPGWFRQLGRRAKVSLVLKSCGVPGFMAVFFVGYFSLLNHPFAGVTVVPVTVIDGFISYHPLAWLPYISLWLYVQVPPLLIDDRRELVLYGSAAAGVSLVGFAFFLFWPTAVPALAIDLAGTSFAGLKSLDSTGNSCPSLHVAFAVFSAVWIERHLRSARASSLVRWLNAGWCGAIVYSTLGTKQHVFWDVCAGALLGAAGAAAQTFLEGRARRRQFIQMTQVAPEAVGAVTSVASGGAIPR